MIPFEIGDKFEMGDSVLTIRRIDGDRICFDRKSLRDSNFLGKAEGSFACGIDFLVKGLVDGTFKKVPKLIPFKFKDKLGNFTWG